MLNVYFRMINSNTLKILKELRSLRHRSIKLWFNKNDCEDVTKYFMDKKCIEHDSIDNNISCFDWDVKETSIVPVFDGLNHLVYRFSIDKTNFVCIDSISHCNDQLVLFRDAVHMSNFPQEFVKVPCFCSLEKFLDYCKSQHIFSFSLEDTSRFVEASGIGPVQGAAVYKEINTQRYWYLDMLHKTHYEVYDKTGKNHLGEADLDGNLDVSKKDSSKSLTL